MSVVSADLQKCKGCFLCVANCPTKAIMPSGKLGKSGYEVVEFDLKKCIGCGSCYQICPDYVIQVL